MYPTDTAVTMWKYSLNANSFVAASEPRVDDQPAEAAEADALQITEEAALEVRASGQLACGLSSLASFLLSVGIPV